MNIFPAVFLLSLYVIILMLLLCLIKRMSSCDQSKLLPCCFCFGSYNEIHLMGVKQYVLVYGAAAKDFAPGAERAAFTVEQCQGS